MTIVRCKDCQFRYNDISCPMCYMETTYNEDDGYDYYVVDRTEDDGFCHVGKPYEDEKGSKKYG